MTDPSTVQKFIDETIHFSILIPTWNNPDYLKLCLRSIRENSEFKNQVIIFVNEGKDETIRHLENLKNIDYIISEKNIGVCLALNSCRSLVKGDYIVYMNDDMYACPGWDLELLNEINRLGTDKFSLSATLIEPFPSKNPNLVSIVKNYGDNILDFQESKLLAEFRELQKPDWYGASWPPNVVSRKIWDMVGGYSIEFTPGFYSDPDFSMKLWRLGIRIYKGVGTSKVYHFGSKSTHRIKHTHNSDIFLMKWGITARTFYIHYLRMGQKYEEALPDHISLSFSVRLRNYLKKLFKCLRLNR